MKFENNTVELNNEELKLLQKFETWFDKNYNAICDYENARYVTQHDTINTINDIMLEFVDGEKL